MQRNDIQGVERAPESLTKYLLLKGGTNPHGEPNYRLVHAATRMMQKGGRWQDWDKNLSERERGGLLRLESGLVIPSHYKPDRVRIEVRTVRKYSFSVGWIMERWIPPAYYGGKDAWYARCVPMSDEPGAPFSNVPFGGPYPEFGDFEMCHHSPSEELPTITQLQNVIDRCERSRTEALRADVQQIVLERINESEWEYEQQREKDRQEHEDYMRDLLSPMNSMSLAAGRWRSELALRAGITEHVGN